MLGCADAAAAAIAEYISGMAHAAGAAPAAERTAAGVAAAAEHNKAAAVARAVAAVERTPAVMAAAPAPGPGRRVCSLTSPAVICAGGTAVNADPSTAVTSLQLRSIARIANASAWV